MVFHSLVHGREMSVSLNMANQNAINIIFDFVFIQDHLRATTKTKSNHLLLLLSRISLNQLTPTLLHLGRGGRGHRACCTVCVALCHILAQRRLAVAPRRLSTW